MVRRLWWIVSLVLVVGGLVLALSSRTDPGDVGWFAYAPLDTGADWHLSWGGSGEVVSRWQLVGWTLATIGVVVVAAGVGFRLGQRRAGLRPPQ